MCVNPFKMQENGPKWPLWTPAGPPWGSWEISKPLQSKVRCPRYYLKSINIVWKWFRGLSCMSIPQIVRKWPKMAQFSHFGPPTGSPWDKNGPICPLFSRPDPHWGPWEILKLFQTTLRDSRCYKSINSVWKWFRGLSCMSIPQIVRKWPKMARYDLFWPA